MKTRGIITFVFDDGYEKVYQNALPILDRYNMPGVFALPIEGNRLEKTEHRKVKPWSQWLPIVARGHEIASHSVTHPNLTKVNDQQLKEELSSAAQKLGATTIIYPGGAVDDHVVETAKQYYTAGRTVQHGFETIPPKEPMRLKSYNFSRKNFSVIKANILALWAYMTNSWLIETYHMVDDMELDLIHSVSQQGFNQHMKFVSRLPIAKKTIQEVVNHE